MSVEIPQRLLEPIFGGSGFAFNGSDVCAGHTRTSTAFAKSAGSKKDGPGRGQDFSRRPAREVAAASFHFAGFIARTRMPRHASHAADRDNRAGV